MIYPKCQLWGENFSPSEIKDIPNIIIQDLNEPGEVSNLGRYKDLPTPYGACSLHTPEEIRSENKIEWMADFILKNKPCFENAGATDITFWIHWTGIQGNMELSVIQLKKIAKTKVPLCMTYMYEEIDE
ncbi:MAG: hypothetical protein R2788_13190 [Saprospiraceae bacterium]